MMNLTEITKKNLNAEKMWKNPKNCKESRMKSVSVFHPAFSHNKGEQNAYKSKENEVGSW